MKKSFFQFPDRRQLAWLEAGAGPPLVLLHGWAMSSAAFRELAGLIAPGYRLLVPDLPGHGDSSPARTNDLVGLAADLNTWLKSVTDEPVVLLGWSLGGMLSIQMVADGALPVDRLILVGTTPRFTNDEDWTFGLPAAQVQAMARNVRRRFEATLSDFFMLTFAGEEMPKSRLREILNSAVRGYPLPDQAVAADLLQLLAVQDQRDALSRIAQPVLVVHGTLDQISPVAAGRYLSEAVPCGEFVEFAGVGHAPFLSQPEAFASRLREFC